MFTLKDTNIKNVEKDTMLMNWPERVWIYSPVRVFFQKREVRKWMRLAPPARTEGALEIGCGLGRGARLLVDRMGFKQVAAFDLEQILVERSARLMPARFNGSIAFHVADAQDLPFRNSSFDAVVNFGIIHHVLDWRKCISEIARVLRSGGFFYFEEIYPPLYANFLLKRMLRHPTEDRFYEPQFLDCLRSNGLHLVDGVRTGSKFGIVGAAKKM
jgi:ubiquinone/menaquinone biosynthesis C-methylase UbiE